MISKAKLNWIAVLAAGFLTSSLLADETPTLKTDQDKVSYMLGVDMARNCKRQGIELDLDLVMRGMNDGLSSEKLAIPEPELRNAMVELQATIRQRRGPNARTAALANKQAGEAFLAENKTREGVMVLPNGLQYKVLKAGEGNKPADTDTVEVNYRGTLLDGTEFFSSETGRPGTFKVKEAVLPVWAEALRLMPVGSKWRLFIPPQLAYGVQGVGRQIGPNETVICDLELLAIK